MPDDIASTKPGDLFLSYHRSDSEAVLTVQGLLRSRGIGTFLDRDQLIAGMPWPQALEQALRQARAVAVFIGPGGLGLWQKREMGYALDRQVQEEGEGKPFPVIPVLLPGADITAGFLFLNTWVDLRADLTDPEALDLLARGVEGVAAAAPPRELELLCPYRGLRPFREEDAAFFHGREAFSRRLLDAVQGRNLVAVVGTSGSGKSSVVKAGVLPLLRRQRPPETTWDAVSFVPGARPFHHLAAALIPLLEPDLDETDRLAEAQKLGDLLAKGEVIPESVVERILGKSRGTDRLLVVADQFEELFTQTAEPERQPFLELLLRALDRSPALTVVLTVRGSFYDSLISASRDLSDRMEQGVVNLGTMTRDELHRAVVEPAKRVGLDFEPGLVKRIIDDVGDEPGNLPLLEFALTELWSRRQGKLMTHGAYEESGGVSGAMARRAEAVFAGLDPAEQERVHKLLTRLVWVGDRAELTLATRQRALVSDLGEESRQVLKVMADARLLVVGRLGATGEETAEVAHEALIRHWERLRGWLDQDREFLLWRRRLGTALTEWERTGQDEGTLLRGTPLREAEQWLADRVADLTPHEREFITGSSALDKRERTTRERRRKTILAASLGSAVVLLVLASLALVQSLEAFSRELAARARAQLSQDPELSLLLATEAVNVKQTDEAVDILRQSLMESHVRLRIEEQDVVTDASFSPDGMRVVTGSDDGAARIWDISGGKPLLARELKGHTAPVTGVAFNPDGSLVVTTSADRTARVWDAITGQIRTELRGHAATVEWASFSPDGASVVTASDDRTARVWDAKTGRLLRVLRGHGAPVTTAAFSPDGRTIVTASLDRSAWVWSSATGRKTAVLRGHQAPLTDAVFGPDGTTIVTASDDNTARVWKLRNGKWSSVRQLVGHADSLTSAAFSPDGRLLVTSSRDRTARVWDARTWLTLSELRGHIDVVTNAAFSPNGSRIVTASRDTTARVWESLNEHGRQALNGHAGMVESAEFSRDGRLVVTASSDNTARLWDAATGATLHELAGHSDSLTGAAFSPDGKLVVTASDDNTARLWSAGTGKALHSLAGHTDNVRMAAFSPDGRLVVTASNDRTARVWDAATGKQVSTLGGGVGGVHALAGKTPRSSIAFSPDGKTVVTTLADSTTFVWDVATGKLLRQMAASRHGTAEVHSERIYTGRFSPDGRLVVTASADATARVWTARTGQALVALKGHDKGVVDAIFSPDGTMIVTASKDGTAGVWEAKSGRLLRRLQGHTDEVTGATFSADGSWIITASKDSTARVWDTATGRTVAVLAGHRDWVTGAEFSPDGRLAVTASRDRTALILERSGEGAWRVMARLFGHSLGVRAHFSADGRSVVTASRDGTARVWRLNESAPSAGGMKSPKASPVVNCETCWPSSGEICTLAAERGAHVSPQLSQLVRDRFLRSHEIRYRVLRWLGTLWGQKCRRP